MIPKRTVSQPQTRSIGISQFLRSPSNAVKDSRGNCVKSPRYRSNGSVCGVLIAKYLPFIAIVGILLTFTGLSPAQKYNEAPMLAKLVKQGKLPPVEERLPENPLILNPPEIGKYGGTLNRVWLGFSDKWGVEKLTGESLVEWSEDGSKIIPCVVTDAQTSNGGRVYAYHIRKGIKWSDGHPFTTEDILFYWEDIQFNTEILNVPGYGYKSGGEYGKLKVLDEHTFQITFKESHLFFHTLIANDLGFTSYPKHYLKQFHPKYTPIGELKKKAKKAGFDTWLQLWSAKSSSSGQGWFVGNPDHPTLFAYKVTQATPERLVHTRNPYYWKVDSAGNQLPYIDEIVHALAEDTTMLNLKAAAGEVDFQGRRLSPNNLPTFMANAEKNNFDVALYDTHIGALPGIFINQTVEDLTLRKIFQDVRFRQALSVAINREEANELVTSGLLTPRQASPASNSIFYRDKLANNYAQYDIKLANRLLDEMGLKWDGKYRLRPDGKKLTVVVSCYQGWLGTEDVDTAEMLKDYWGKIGVDVAVDNQAREQLMPKWANNKLQISLYVYFPSYSTMVHFVPYATDSWSNSWAPLYSQWYHYDEKQGEKPTPEMQALFDLHQKILVAETEAEQSRLLEQIVQNHIDNLWVIGVVGDVPQPIIISKRLGNAPREGVYALAYNSPKNIVYEIFYFKN